MAIKKFQLGKPLWKSRFSMETCNEVSLGHFSGSSLGFIQREKVQG